MSDSISAIPNSPEAEKGVLSCCLQDNDCIDVVANVIGGSPDAFYSPGRQSLWLALFEERAAGRVSDVVTLTELLRGKGRLDEVGGMPELAELLGFAPAVAHLKHYLLILTDKALLRSVIRKANETIAEAYSGPADVRAWTGTVEARHTDLLGADPNDDSFAAAVRELADQLADAEQGRERAVPFGLEKLDALLGIGVRPKQLAVIAARPSQGKTSIGWQQMADLVTHVGHPRPVGFFSLEMPRADVVAREVCRRCGIAFADLSSAFRTLPPSQRRVVSERVTKCFMEIVNWPLRIDDRGSLHIDQIRAKARMWRRRYQVEMLVIDYLQLCRGEGENRQLEVGYISSQCKAMAKELDVPVILLAQLNRAAAGAEPETWHLRESGAVEQDADIILLIGDDEDEKEEREGCVPRKIKVGKNRNGATHPGIPVWFEERRMTFIPRIALPT